MTKQEFLAMSLPYGLKYKYPNGTYSLFDAQCYNKVDRYDSNYNIVLRPLSDLIKQIEHNGDRFVPIERLRDIFVADDQGFMHKQIENFEYESIWGNFEEIEFLPFVIIHQILKWHFDIAGLIEKSEAIDVNTLEVNPYK